MPGEVAAVPTTWRQYGTEERKLLDNRDLFLNQVALTKLPRL